MSLAIWLALGGDASLIVGVIMVRVITTVVLNHGAVINKCYDRNGELRANSVVCLYYTVRRILKGEGGPGGYVYKYK